MTADQYLDQLYASLPEVHCQGKCGWQICGPILAFPIEIARMEKASGHPLACSVRDGTATCGYFDRINGRCTVYDVRPLICRLYGAVNAATMRCPHGCKPDRWVSDDEVEVWLHMLKLLTGKDLMTGELR